MLQYSLESFYQITKGFRGEGFVEYRFCVEIESAIKGGGDVPRKTGSRVYIKGAACFCPGEARSDRGTFSVFVNMDAVIFFDPKVVTQ